MASPDAAPSDEVAPSPRGLRRRFPSLQASGERPHAPSPASFAARAQSGWASSGGSGAEWSSCAICRYSRRRRPPRRTSCSSAASREPYSPRICAAVLGPTPRAPGSLSDVVAAQRDEVRDLLRLHAVALSDLGRADPRDLAHAAWVGGWSRSSRRAGTRRGRRSPPTPVRRARPPRRLQRPRSHPLRTRRPSRPRSRRTQQVREAGRAVRAVPGRTRGRTGTSRTTRGGRWHLQGVPGDEQRARLLDLPQPDEHVGEADQSPGRTPIRPTADRPGGRGRRGARTSPHR